MKRLLQLGVALAFVSATPAGAATITGIAKDPAVVWVSDTPPEPPAGVTIRQTMKTFVPGFLIVPVGTTITFPNDDPFYHSVYSDSPGNAFDLGLYDNGPGKSVRFATPGVVDIHCHVHGSMHATVLVVDGPYAQTQAPGASYRIDGLTPGRHVEHVWTHGDVVTDTPIVVR